MITRFRDRRAARDDAPKAPPSVGSLCWQDVDAETIERRAEILIKAFCWVMGEDWTARWADRRAEVRSLMEGRWGADLEHAKACVLLWSWQLNEELEAAGRSFDTLLKDPDELARFWKRMHRQGRCHPPTPGDLATLESGARRLTPDSPRAVSRELTRDTGGRSLIATGKARKAEQGKNPGKS